MPPRTLFPHQRAALAYAAKRSRIALYMEMRLGKTLVAIRWAMQHKLDRVLMVAPMSVLSGWVDELLAEGVRVSDIHWLLGSAAERRLIAGEIDTGWALINYEGLRTVPDVLKLPWSGLILDESTRIRNPKAQITKVLLRDAPHIMHRAILSGLPAPESPLDYFCQMAFLHGSFLGMYNYWAFRQRHFIPDVRGWTWEPKREARDAIKQEVHKQAFVLTRKAAGLGERKLYEKRVVDMTPAQKQAYTQVAKDFAFRHLETQWATTRLLWMARLAGGFSPDTDHPELISSTKLDELVSLLTGELQYEPVVVWFRFNEELHHASLRLGNERISHRVIIGDTSVEDRRAHVHAFQESAVRVLLMQVKCGKFGLNTSRSSTAIYYSNSYDFEDRAQSEDRIVHPSKKEPLLYIDLITKGTVDSAVVAALRDKHVSSRTFMTRLVDHFLADYYATYGRNAAFTPSADRPAPPAVRYRRLHPGDLAGTE